MAEQFMQRLASVGTFYSDCTVGVDGAKDIAAHRLVLHIYSKVFADLLEKTPPSDADGTVYLDLKADDPNAVRAMLDFFYKGTYSEPLSMSASPMAFHITVFDLAIKYQIPALRDTAITFFRDVLDSGSCPTKDLLEAAGKLEDVSSPNLAIVDTLRSDIINAFSERSHSIFDDPAFKTFIQAHPEWVIRLLKTSAAESTPRQQHGSTGNNEVATASALDGQGKEDIEAGFPAMSDMEHGEVYDDEDIASVEEQDDTIDEFNATASLEATNTTSRDAAAAEADWDGQNSGTGTGWGTTSPFDFEGRLLGHGSGGSTKSVFEKNKRKGPSRGLLNKSVILPSK